jgi:hypothetical protein
LAEVIDNISAYWGPRTDAPALPPQTSIADDSGVNGLITPIHQMISKDLVYKVLLGLALDVDQ